jgi:hypothetical protein
MAMRAAKMRAGGVLAGWVVSLLALGMWSCRGADDRNGHGGGAGTSAHADLSANTDGAGRGEGADGGAGTTGRATAAGPVGDAGTDAGAGPSADASAGAAGDAGVGGAAGDQSPDGAAGTSADAGVDANVGGAGADLPESFVGCRGPLDPGCEECIVNDRSFLTHSAPGVDWYNVESIDGECSPDCPSCASCTYYDERAVANIGMRPDCLPCTADPGIDPCHTPNTCDCWCSLYQVLREACPTLLQ